MLKYAKDFLNQFSLIAPKEVSNQSDIIWVAVAKYFGVGLEQLGIGAESIDESKRKLREDTMGQVVGSIVNTYQGMGAGLTTLLAIAIFAEFEDKKEQMESDYIQYGISRYPSMVLRIYYLCLLQQAITVFEQLLLADDSLDARARKEIKQTITQGSLVQQLFVNNEYPDDSGSMDFYENLLTNIQRISDLPQRKFNQLVLRRPDIEHDSTPAASSSSNSPSASFFAPEPTRKSGIFSFLSCFKR